MINIFIGKWLHSTCNVNAQVVNKPITFQDLNKMNYAHIACQLLLYSTLQYSSYFSRLCGKQNVMFIKL